MKAVTCHVVSNLVPFASTIVFFQYFFALVVVYLRVLVLLTFCQSTPLCMYAHSNTQKVVVVFITFSNTETAITSRHPIEK